MTSKHLNERQLAAVCKIGDQMVPGDEELPSFSRLGCVEYVDHLLDPMPASDLGDLKMLLLILSFLPGFMIGLLLRFLEWSPWVPGPVGGPLRMIRLGLRGVVMSLYYSGFKGKEFSGRTPFDVIGYKVGVYTGDRN